MKRSTLIAALFAGIVSFNCAASAQDLLPQDNGLWDYHASPRWRESEEHPLRIAAYIVHPVGWVLREAIFRPISYFTGSTKFTRSFFGYREPFDYKEPLCFSGSDNIPDCKTMAPFMTQAAEDVEDDGADDATVEEQKVVFPDVNFDFNKSALNELGKARVRQVSQMLGAMPTVSVVVEGHADIKGTDDYNMKLGMRRAETVMKELTELGIDKGRMSPVSYGESRPLYTEDTDWARAANRRVQFSVQGAAPVEPVASNETTTGEVLPAAAK